MNLSNIEAKMEAELVRDLDFMHNLEPGSKEHLITGNSIKNLYSAMATTKHNSDSTRIMADKNESDAILKDEENKGKLELERLKIENEKEKLELERVRLENEKRKLELEKERLENEKAREEAKIDIEKTSKNGQLMLDKWKNETQFEIERDKLKYDKAEVDGKLALDRNRLDIDRDKVDVERSRITLETKKHNEAVSQLQTENVREWRKIENDEKWHRKQFEIEQQKMANDLRIREAQNRATLIGCYCEGCSVIAKAVISGGVGLIGLKGILSFEQTGCVTTKALSWIPKLML